MNDQTLAIGGRVLITSKDMYSGSTGIITELGSPHPDSVWVRRDSPDSNEPLQFNKSEASRLTVSVDADTFYNLLSCARECAEWHMSLRDRHVTDRKLSEAVFSLAAAQSQATTSDVCLWKSQGYDEPGWWDTGCGKTWWTEDFPDTPQEGGMNYCFNCGKRVEAVAWVDETEAEDDAPAGTSGEGETQ